MKNCVRCRRSYPDDKVHLGLCDECFESDSTNPQAANTRANAVILSTSIDVPGREIESAIGLVSAESALAQGVIKDIGNSWRDFIGGKSSNVQSAIRQVRDVCFSQLKNEAANAGADAVVSVQISYHDIGSTSIGGILFIAATGTAVKLKAAPRL